MVLKVAWIGNSYTYFFDMPGMVTALSSSASPPVIIQHQQTLHGGWTLGQHFRKTDDTQMEATGVGRVEGGARDLLSKGDFDFVVLQDQSQTPGYDVSGVDEADLRTALDFVKGDSFLKESVDSGGRGRGDSGPLNRAESLLRLREYYGPAIARCGAQPVLYSSWGRQHGQVNANAPEYATFEGMLRCLTDGVREYSAVLHKSMAEHAGGSAPPRIAPAGKAFSLIRADTEAIVHFDRLYVADESHPDFPGSYLVALVFFAVLTGRSPVGLAAPNRETKTGEMICNLAEAWANQTLRGGGSGEEAGNYTCALTALEANYLQQIAHTAVFGSAPRL